jgi:hypothetical protein
LVASRQATKETRLLNLQYCAKVFSNFVINGLHIMNILDLLKKGNEVANPASVKSGQITSNSIVTLSMAFLSLFSAFGYDLKISQELVISIVSGFSALMMVVNTVLTVISSKKAGF